MKSIQLIFNGQSSRSANIANTDMPYANQPNPTRIFKVFYSKSILSEFRAKLICTEFSLKGIFCFLSSIEQMRLHTWNWCFALRSFVRSRTLLERKWHVRQCGRRLISKTAYLKSSLAQHLRPHDKHHTKTIIIISFYFRALRCSDATLLHSAISFILRPIAMPIYRDEWNKKKTLHWILSTGRQLGKEFVS